MMHDMNGGANPSFIILARTVGCRMYMFQLHNVKFTCPISPAGAGGRAKVAGLDQAGSV